MAIINAVVLPDDLNQWSEFYEAKENLMSTADRQVAQVLVDFRRFSLEYLEFFDILKNSPQLNQTSISEDRLKSRVLQAFNDYWAPLGEIAAQRQLKPYREHLETLTTYATDLLGTFLNQNASRGVLVYFNKANAIRYYPYTDIAFIAMPYTQLISKDRMSIPHEIGHYLYWNMADSLANVRTKHRQLNDQAEQLLRQAVETVWSEKQEQDAVVRMCLEWLEEIYCDIVGARLAGKEFVNSFQQLIKNQADKAEDLVFNDRHHPPLCLRAFLREFALQQTHQEKSGVDWPNFFTHTFAVHDIDSLLLPLPVLNPEEEIQKLSNEHLIALFKADSLGIQPSGSEHQVALTKLLPVMEKFVAFLAQHLDEIQVTGLSRRQTQLSAFEELHTIAEQDSLVRQKPAFEILLNPTFLEGGEQHAHSAWAHFESHYVGTHNH
jgi:hypothetical protein